MFSLFFNLCISVLVSGKENGVIFATSADGTGGKENLDKCYREGITGNDRVFYGSFCTESAGYYRFKLIGRQTIYFDKFGNFNVEELYYKDLVKSCEPTNYVVEAEWYMDGHTCYPFKIRMGYYCLFQKSHLEFQVRFPGESNYRYVDTSNAIRDFNYFDCVDGWYGGQCQNKVVSYCNINGYVNDKKSGDGYCTCYAYSGPFCEDPNTNYYSQKPTVNITNPFGVVEETFYLTSNPMSFDEYFYSGIEIIGKIKIPQTGNYHFKAKSTGGVQLKIGETTVGSPGELFGCSERNPIETNTISGYFERGEVTFFAKILTSCVFYNNVPFELYWKNFRYNWDNSNTAWELINMRFLGS